jgi:carboxymethylenebutenolidase
MWPEIVLLTTADGPTPATIAHPGSPPRGGVLVVHEAFGLTDHIAGVCRRLAAAGWLAVAPSLFHRQGAPVNDYDDLASARAAAAALTTFDIMDDIDAGLIVLADGGTAVDRSAVIGFGMGGTIAFHAAAHRPVGAAVTYAGAGIRVGCFGEQALVDLAPRLRSPWLGLYGDQDTTIGIDEVEELRATALRADVATEIIRYPDAGHGFYREGHDACHRLSATDAWARTLTWLDANIPTFHMI